METTSPADTHAGAHDEPPRPFAASEADVALLLRVARGEPKARRTLAQRLVARVRRAAYAVMGPVPEAEEAAAAALTELVRAAATFPTELSLYAWCDRQTAKSAVRFAHALQVKLLAPAPQAGAASAHSLEDLLARLPAPEREVFALLHVFNFSMRALADLVGRPEVSVREDLELARGAFAAMTLRATHTDPPAELRQFWTLYDRARSQADEHGLPETAVASLSAFGEWAIALLRALEEARNFLVLTRHARLTSQDRAVLARALSALVVTSAQSSDPGQERSARADAPFDRDGPAWIPPACIAGCIAMLVAAFVALAYHHPRTTLAPHKPPRPAQAAVVSASVSSLGARAKERTSTSAPPTVEALPKALTAGRGAALRRGAISLAPLTPLYEGDVLRAADAPGCLRIEPLTELCLGVGTELELTRFSRADRTITLLHGRLVVALESQTAPLHVLAGSAQLDASAGTFGLEREDQDVVIRPLLGRADLQAYGATHDLSVQAAIVRGAGNSLERLPLHPEKARRDWELFAAHRPVPARTADSATRLGESAPAAPEQGALPATDQATAPEP